METENAKEKSNAENETEEVIESNFDYVKAFKPKDPLAGVPENLRPIMSLPYFAQWGLIFRVLVVATVVNKLFELYYLISGDYYDRYSVSAQWVYETYGDALRYNDIFHGTLLLFTAICGVIAFFAIKGFKKTSFPLVLATYLSCIINGVVTAAVRTNITQSDFFIFWVKLSIIGSLILIIGEGIVFHKYKSYFDK